MTAGTLDAQSVLDALRAIGAEFAGGRSERQRRRELDPADFARIADAGFLRMTVPVAMGGLFESIARSTRPICEQLRVLATGDSSVALVASMHPAVLHTMGWLGIEAAPAPYTEAWATQRTWVFQSALDGAWWGTITSEPGSGGDMRNTRTTAVPDGSSGAYRLTGQKHFGSGSGVMTYMMTSAVAEGESEPDLFFMQTRDVPWDGSAGITLTAPWDGHGMTATQSHAMRFDGFPAIRSALPGFSTKQQLNPGGMTVCLFTAVIAGIVDAAMETARAGLAPRKDALRAFEQVEWTRAEMESWLIAQAYEGMLRATETENGRNTLLGKTAVAELAESVLSRILRILGGSGYSRSSPFGFWAEDVRALGFLRPPWTLAFEQLHQSIWDV